jgi:phosphotransferase system enzyme I (PtsI)
VEITLRGIGVSPGIAIGPSCLFQVQALDVPRYTISDPKLEIKRFREAVDKARADLQVIMDRTEEELGEQHAAIFNVHMEMLNDPAFSPEIEKRCKEESLNAESLVQDWMDNYSNVMEQIDDPLFKERAMDFIDVGRRILSNLMEKDIDTLDHLEKPSVVVAHDLTPSDTTNMDITNTLGLATDGGGPTSHMAILARAFEIPSVVGLRFLGKQLQGDDTIIVDGTKGYVIVRPTESTVERYEEEKTRQDAQRLALLEASTDGPVTTIDGTEITTLANIELLAETQKSINAKCQGVGLFRTEFLFMNRSSLPSEEEQFHSYRKIMEAMGDLSVTMRTLDLGGDKIIPSLNIDEETNPQLGWRSIRLCLDRPDIFKAQLRALYRASVFGNMQIMFPMITGLDQWRSAKQVVEEVIEDLNARKVDFSPDVKIGCMIEVPAAVEIADKLAVECDFFSIGTNDLIQYTLAVDRVNPRTAHLYAPTHLSVLRMIKRTLDAAKTADIPCTICGEMAGDSMLTELLLGLGARSLSMSSASLPMVRAEIANTKIPSAKSLVRKTMDIGSVSEINALLQNRAETRNTMALYLKHHGDKTRD